VKTQALARVAVVAALSASLAAGTAVTPATATPAGQKAALAHLKSDWSKKPASFRKGTCLTYHKYPNSTLVQSTNKAWATKANHKNMTIAEWLKVYKAFFKWAC